MELKPFDRNDWMAFAGAEGENPKIAWHEHGYIAVDKNGIWVGVDDATWYYECTQRLGEFIVNGMSEQDLTNTYALGFDLGFVRID